MYEIFFPVFGKNLRDFAYNLEEKRPRLHGFILPLNVLTLNQNKPESTAAKGAFKTRSQR